MDRSLWLRVHQFKILKNRPKLSVIEFMKLATFIFHCRYQNKRFIVIKTILVMINKKNTAAMPGSDAISVKRAPRKIRVGLRTGLGEMTNLVNNQMH